VRSIEPHALALLEAYDWPGNIRQLENAMFRAVVLCDGAALTVEEFPQIRAQVENTADLERRVANQAVDVEATTYSELAGPDVPQPQEPPLAAGTLRALDESGDVRSLSDMEYDMIMMALDRYAGQMSEVARRLGIGRSTLYRKLKEYGIDPDKGNAAS
jgi:DNA-binding NtrC family response regulator